MAFTLDLDGAVVVVTGASRGIGAATAHKCAEAGARLALTALNKEDVEYVAKDIQSKFGVECFCHFGDVADIASVETFYRDIHNRFGRVDCLFSNAGILVDGVIGMLRSEDINRLLEVNVKGMMYHIQFASRLMRRNKAGSIILTSSIIGRNGNKGQMAYAATKAALLGIMKSAAKELGPDGIRVNAIAPGVIETDMTEHLTPDMREHLMRGIALGHSGRPEDVANVVLFLASPMAAYVSGQVVGVDGGMVI